jgi:phosphoribosyl 1,2-cyclic phosphodiesterase
VIGYCPLASGSKGNCVYIGTNEGKLLIDAGLSAREIKRRLEEINVDLSEIDAILITHEHVDHIRGLQVLGCRMGIPVFANSDTAKAIYAFLHECPKFKIFATGETFEFGGMEIHPFSIQHDAIDPVGFTIRIGSVKLGFCADLGFATTLVASHLYECDYLYIESNHEPSMVHASARPLVYKQRVLSRQGHLSNAQCAALVNEIQHSGLKQIHLAHLSQECNHPETALRTVQSVLKYSIPLTIAPQDTPSLPIFFSSDPHRY